MTVQDCSCGVESTVEHDEVCAVGKASGWPSLVARQTLGDPVRDDRRKRNKEEVDADV